jgi:hypothetical protein
MAPITSFRHGEIGAKTVVILELLSNSCSVAETKKLETVGGSVNKHFVGRYALMRNSILEIEVIYDTQQLLEVLGNSVSGYQQSIMKLHPAAPADQQAAVKCVFPTNFVDLFHLPSR